MSRNRRALPGSTPALPAANGAFRLTPGTDVRATIADITENPKTLRLVGLEAPRIPRLREAIAIAGADSPFANLVVLQRDNQNDEICPFVQETSQGSAVPAF